jgi:hypothetical protein
MTRNIVVFVPLAPSETMTLLMSAAAALQHRVVAHDLVAGECEIHADFSLRALATFHVHAHATLGDDGRTRLHLRIRPGHRIVPWTGVGQSERTGWELVGKMQQLLDPERYSQLAQNVLPPQRAVRR